jgi:hypothetical protein
MGRTAQLFRRWTWFLRNQGAERAENTPTERLAETQRIPKHAYLDAGDEYVFCHGPQCKAIATLLTADRWEFREIWIDLPPLPGREPVGLIKRECRCPLHRSGAN